ncbi:MAG: hypothetical protein PF481_00705 [Bacteroidales bacterium]|jgi:hypothetical protein|nr:hypothetical protein [Bacteroidales bacterium]
MIILLVSNNKYIDQAENYARDFKIHIAKTGKEAIYKCLTNTYDEILLSQDLVDYKYEIVEQVIKKHQKADITILNGFNLRN